MVSKEQPILIVQTAFLGDLLLTVPLLKRLRKTQSSSEIHLVCRRGIGSLFKDLKLVDQVFEIEKGQRQSYKVIQEQIKSLHYKWILCPHQSLTSAFFVRPLSADKKISFKQWWNTFFFDELIVRDLSLPDALRQSSLLLKIDAEVKEQIESFKKQKSFSVPGFFSAEVNIPWSDKNDFKNPYICFFPGSVWATKQWSEEGFLKLGQEFSQQYQIILMGGEGERSLTERLSQKIPHSISMAGKTSLQESLSIIEKSQFVVTNDSAGQHLASLVAKPTISIFGPTILDFGYRPWNNKAVIVEPGPLKCRPCGKHGHAQCPIGTHECMKSITVAQVKKAMLNLPGIPQG